MATAIVVNKRFGGFSLSDMAVEALGLESRYDLSDTFWTEDYKANRTRIDLIRLIEEKGREEVSGTLAMLNIVYIPDEATDWMIQENDGYETVVYVVDGKLWMV